MRVVIVGGAGFIGTTLARHLASHGHAVRVLDTAERLAAAGPALEGAECANFDFTDGAGARAHLEDQDAMVHLACTSHPASSMATIARDAEANIAPSLRLFDAASEAGVSRVVFASSGGTVYGVPPSLPVSESVRPSPISAYGVSKLAIEHYLSLYPTLSGVSLRVANPYGTYQLQGTAIGVMARYVSLALGGASLDVWGDGSVVRDYVAIGDVVEAFRLAVVQPVLAPGAYNVGTGVGTSVNEIIDAIGAATGRELNIHYLDARPYDVPAIYLDCAKFHAAAGWRPSISLEQGVEDLVNVAMNRRLSAGAAS